MRRGGFFGTCKILTYCITMSGRIAPSLTLNKGMWYGWNVTLNRLPKRHTYFDLGPSLLQGSGVISWSWRLSSTRSGSNIVIEDNFSTSAVNVSLFYKGLQGNCEPSTK